MLNITDLPLLLFAIALVVLWGSIRIGALLSARFGTLGEDVRKDLETIQAATLALLGLLIGFAFSMAISRYEDRKMYEEAEANAIGTEYVRADLLPAAAGAKVRSLMSNYLEQRILFYSTRNTRELRQINARTDRLETELRSAVVNSGAVASTPVIALAVSGMNDVLNSRGYAVAARQTWDPGGGMESAGSNRHYLRPDARDWRTECPNRTHARVGAAAGRLDRVPAHR
jgi:hypothetical protein